MTGGAHMSTELFIGVVQLGVGALHGALTVELRYSEVIRHISIAGLVEETCHDFDMRWCRQLFRHTNGWRARAEI